MFLAGLVFLASCMAPSDVYTPPAAPINQRGTLPLLSPSPPPLPSPSPQAYDYFQPRASWATNATVNDVLVSQSSSLEDFCWSWMLGYLGLLGFMVLSNEYMRWRRPQDYRRTRQDYRRANQGRSLIKRRPRKALHIGQPRRLKPTPLKNLDLVFRRRDVMQLVGSHVKVSLAKLECLTKPSPAYHPLVHLGFHQEDGSSSVEVKRWDEGPVVYYSKDFVDLRPHLTHLVVVPSAKTRSHPNQVEDLPDASMWATYFPYHDSLTIAGWYIFGNFEPMTFHFPQEEDLDKAVAGLKETDLPELSWDPLRDRLWFVPPDALDLREHLVQIMMARSVWPSHVRFTLDDSDAFDMAAYPGTSILEPMISPASLERVIYGAAGRKIVTILRPHRFPHTMVYYY